VDDARGPVLKAALAEARRRGDRRIGTEHLLLGMLHEPVAASAFGVELADAHRALEELDREALAAVGLDVGGLRLTGRLPLGRRQALTSGARAVLLRSITSGRKRRRPTMRDMVSALLDRTPPDPAAALLARLGVDAHAVRARLHE
jgi:ATP-dependent Clp protease ATP-binding subunit ClpA